jgi:hypothetical protein
MWGNQMLQCEAQTDYWLEMILQHENRFRRQPDDDAGIPGGLPGGRLVVFKTGYRLKNQ